MLINNKMPYEAIYYMFSRIENNKEFYLRVVKVTGQNSFEEIISNNLTNMFNELFVQYGRNNNKSNKSFSSDDIAEYYSRGLTFIIKRWIEDGIRVPAKTLTKKYERLVTNSLDDIVHDLIES